MSETNEADTYDTAGEDNTLLFRDRIISSDYTKIPNLVMWCAALSVEARFVYGIILSFAWGKGRAWPGQQKIAEKAGWAVVNGKSRSVSRYIAELVSAGLIEVRRRGQKSNLYWVSIDFDPEWLKAHGLAVTAPGRHPVPADKATVANREREALLKQARAVTEQAYKEVGAARVRNYRKRDTEGVMRLMAAPHNGGKGYSGEDILGMYRVMVRTRASRPYHLEWLSGDVAFAWAAYRREALGVRELLERPRTAQEQAWFGNNA